jgi:hypothetical protein
MNDFQMSGTFQKLSVCGPDCSICASIDNCKKCEWFYNWFYDLLEWEKSNMDLCRNTLLGNANRFRWRSTTEKVKKIRIKLGDLETNMVILLFLESAFGKF